MELCKAFRAASGYLCSINQNNVIHMYEILRLVNEMSPYLLLGFFVAGLLHVFVPGSLYSRYLSGADLRSVLLAALFGIPLPLCSCGVIPTAMSLRKEGASKGATTSFLIATPQTGVDSILATYSILGLPLPFCAHRRAGDFGVRRFCSSTQQIRTARRLHKRPTPTAPTGKSAPDENRPTPVSSIG